MPAGSTATSRPANLTTRLSRMGRLEAPRAACVSPCTHMIRMCCRLLMFVCVCVRLHKCCTFGTYTQRSDYMHTHQSLRGHGVGMVGSSWTGNIHPTPAIELLQGKRGDHGCMAKAGFVSLASSLIFSYVYAHCRVAGEGRVCIFSRFMYSIACLTLIGTPFLLHWQTRAAPRLL